MMVATKPVDSRKEADSLAALGAGDYGGKPYSGAICVFRSKRAYRIKLIWWDGTGLCLMAKRLEQGAFRWPPIQECEQRNWGSNRSLGNRPEASGMPPETIIR